MRTKLLLSAGLATFILSLLSIFWYGQAFGEGAQASEYDALLARFKATGASVSSKSETRSFEPFSVPAHQVRINGAAVDILVYKDSKSADTEAALISPQGFIIGNAILEGNLHPHFYKSGRFLLFYNGSDPAVLHILSGVVGKQIAGV